MAKQSGGMDEDQDVVPTYISIDRSDEMLDWKKNQADAEYL